MNKSISLVINCDSRSGFQDSESSAETMLNGCRSIDFMTEGIRNKIALFKGFELETIVYLDEHEKIPENIVAELRGMVDTLVIRKHNKRYGDLVYCHNFNCFNYLSALFMARNQIICHMDQDCAAFTKDKGQVDELIAMLDNYKFVSYPSHWSPNAVADSSFGGMTWASTRFFLCKRETLKFDTLIKCILDPEWMYATFGESPRRCNWLEHQLSKTNDNSVYYPPINLDKLAIFSWGIYKAGTLKKLNAMSYGEVKNFVIDNGGIVYPNELYIK